MEETETAEKRIAEFSRETYDEFLADYDELHERIAEYPSMIVYADTHGYELNEWAEEIGVSRREVAEWMHDQAKGVNYNWSASDPVVLLRD